AQHPPCYSSALRTPLLIDAPGTALHYRLSLHDALPIFLRAVFARRISLPIDAGMKSAGRKSFTTSKSAFPNWSGPIGSGKAQERSDEHTSEHQTRSAPVLRLRLVELTLVAIWQRLLSLA